MSDALERSDLVEAKLILKGLTGVLVEKRHLEALEEHYQSEIIKIVWDIDQLTKAALRRN